MARRLNTKFLGIGAIALVVAAGGAYLGKKLLVNKNPAPLIAQGDMLMAEHHYGEAVNYYGSALRLDSTDANLQVKIGDALNQLSNEKVENVGGARQAWNRALEIDPQNVPALKRLLQSYREEVQLQQRPRAELFEQIRGTCKKLLRIDPNDSDADGNLQIATIQQWLSNFETDRAAIDQAISGLSDLMRKDPANAQFPYYIAQAKVRRGDEYQRISQLTEASRMFAEAIAVFDDPLRQQNKNAMMYLLSAQVMNTMQGVDQTPGAAEKYRSRCSTILDRARLEIPQSDPKYPDILMACANLAIQQGNSADAEKIYRDLRAQRPDDINVRLALASILAFDPVKRDEAIEILSAPVTIPSGITGPGVILAKNQEYLIQLQLTNLRLDAYATKKDEAERKKLMAEAQAGYDTLAEKLGERPEVMKLQGKMQLLRGETIEAIQTLSRAMALLGENSKDYDLMFLLARAYATSKQTGQARPLLQKILDKFPSSIQARMMLADLLIHENNLLEAKPHVEYLEEKLPNAPEVLKLRLAFKNTQTQAEEIKAIYDKLPETNRRERIDKAQIAINIKNFDEAIRLLENVRTPDGSEPQAMALLAKLYLATDKKDKALEVAQEAGAANPKDFDLKILIAQIKGAPPEEIAKLQRERVENIPDPFERELGLADIARDQNNPEDFFKHLKAAAAINATDKRVMEGTFQFYLSQRRWDDAEKYLKTLTEANADLANGRLYRFRMLMAKQDYPNALEVSRELCRSMSEFSQSWLAQGQALEASGQGDDALQKYVFALEKQSGNIEALRGAIRVSYALNRPDSARQFLSQARRAFPSDTTFRDMEVDHELKYGDPEKAVAPRLQAVNLGADQPNNWLQLGLTYFRVAQVRAGNGDSKSALEFLDKAKTTFSQSTQKFPDEPTFYGALAEVCLVSDKYAEGEKVLKQLQARPSMKDSPRPSLMLADYYQRSGKMDECEMALRDALKKSRNDSDVQEKLALILSQRGKFDDALQVLDPRSADPRIRKKRMEVLMASGRVKEAEKDLLDALDRAPNSPELLNLLTALYIGTQRWEDAAARANQELANDPQDITAMYHLGLIYTQQPQPDPDAAIKQLTTVKLVNPQHVDARFALSEAYRLKNDTENAIRELESSLQSSPTNKTIRTRLIEMYIAAHPARLGDADRLIDQAVNMAEFKNDPDFYRVRAFTSIARGDSQKAVTASRRAVELSKNNPLFIKAYLDVLYQTKNYADLEQQTTQLIQQTNKVWWLYQSRAMARKNLKNMQGAIADYQAGLSAASEAKDEDGVVQIVRSASTELGVDTALAMIAPRAEKELRYRLLTAQLYHVKGDYENSVKIVRSAMAGYDKLNPKEQEFLLRFAAGVFVTSVPPHMDEAKQTYVKLVEKVPNDFTALNNLACILAERVSPPQPQEALKYSQRAYDLVRNAGRMEPTVYDTHGWVLTLAGRVEEGMIILQKVIETKPIPESHYHLGQAYLRINNAERAKNQFQECIESITSAENNKQTIDPDLKAKVERGIKDADDMMKGKSPRANVP